MIRFISFLLGKDYEPCKSCQTLKAQLDIANLEKHQLLDTILSFTKPAEIAVNPPIMRTLDPISKAVPWRIRKARLEAESRREMELKKRHDEEIKKLEEEVGLETEDAG